MTVEPRTDSDLDAEDDDVCVEGHQTNSPQSGGLAGSAVDGEHARSSWTKPQPGPGSFETVSKDLRSIPMEILKASPWRRPLYVRT